MSDCSNAAKRVRPSTTLAPSPSWKTLVPYRVRRCHPWDTPAEAREAAAAVLLLEFPHQRTAAPSLPRPPVRSRPC